VGDVLFNLRASLYFLAQVRQDQSDARTRENKEEIMDLLWTLAVILLILWILGLVTSYTLGGFIHLLLVLAIIVILLRVIQGRKPIP
jgi:asparagine N-glycosylation enzyme membrane subunit Stt3